MLLLFSILNLDTPPAPAPAKRGGLGGHARPSRRFRIRKATGRKRRAR